MKKLGHAMALLGTAPCGLTSHLEDRLRPGRETIFRFWADLFSLLPGLPGGYLRRAYYCWTLESCSPNCHIGFGTIFSHRKASIADAVYIGTYVLLGAVQLDRGALIGSRSSLISGGSQHRRDASGEWTATELSELRQIKIGERAWLGEACLVAANVGAGAMVAAGAVVVANVPDDIMVAGNPARFVRRLEEPQESSPPRDTPPGEASVRRDGLLAKAAEESAPHD